MERYYAYLLLGTLFLLALGLLLALIRAIRGPRIADRIMGVNLIGTISLACIAILAVYLKQSWLVDVSLIYAMLSFLTVVVLCQVHLASKGKEDDPDD